MGTVGSLFRRSGVTTSGHKLGVAGSVDNVPLTGVIPPSEYWNYHGIPNWIFHIYIQSGSYAIQALHLYLMWTLVGVVLAHGPDPTIALVSDMGTLARPRQGVVHHIMHICLAIMRMDMSPGAKDQGLGSRDHIHYGRTYVHDE